MYNFYMFKIAMPLPHIPEALLFTGINITDFFKRFENMIINYGLFDDRKV